MSDHKHTWREGVGLAPVFYCGICENWLTPELASTLEAERDALREALRRIADTENEWTADGGLNAGDAYFMQDVARQALEDCPLHGVAHSSHDCAAMED